jgi:hypothetical protein
MARHSADIVRRRRCGTAGQQQQASDECDADTHK